MNDEDFMNIVNEIFEEMKVDDIIEEMSNESDKKRYLMTVIINDVGSMIVGSYRN